MREHSGIRGKRTREKGGFVRAKILRHQAVLVILVASIGVLLSILLYVTIRHTESGRAEIVFENSAKERISVLKDHIEQNLQTLDWVAGFFRSAQEVERSEFREFTRAYFETHHEVRAVQWIPLVRNADRAAYEAAVRDDELSSFQITERRDDGEIVRATQREEYFPVHFVEPYEGNEEELGFDFASSSVSLEALHQSRDADRPTAIDPIASTRQAGDEHTILVFRPVYDNEIPTDLIEDRREYLKGFVLAVLRTDSFLDHVLARFEPFGMDIYLCDPSAPKGRCSPSSHLSRTRSGEDKTPVNFCTTERLSNITGLYVTGTLEVADREWTVLCVPAPAFLEKGRTLIPFIAMMSGLGFTGLLTLLGLAILQRIARSREFTVQLLRSRQELRNEVADHERTERALRKSEKRLSLAVEGSNDGLWDWPDVDNDKEWWSPRWYELLGYKDREIEASYSNFLRLLHPDDLERTKEAFGTHFERREPVDIEYRLRTKSDEYRWFRGRGQAIWDQDGKARRMSGSIQDITQQKKAEARILREKRFSENLIDSSVDGILAYDDKCHCTIWNPGMERISGVSREQALGKCALDVFPFLKKTEENRFFYEALAGRTVIARDRPYILPETEGRGFFEGHYSPLCNAAGDIIGGLAIMRDVTARKRAEEEVQKSKSLYQNLVETSHDLIFQCDNKGEFVFLNKAWESTTGYRIEEMIGQPFSKFKRPDLIARDSEAFEKLLEGESIAGYETIYITKSGEERYLLFDVVPRCDISGRVIGTQGTAFDFTDRKRAEQALEAMNEELETTVERLIVANRELADFAHIAAHDLRTPLRGIGSLASIVSAEYSDKLDERGIELLEMLVGRASRMYEQIGSILEYSEIGRIEEKKRNVNLNKLVKEIIGVIAVPENVEISIAGRLPALTCNATRISQVFRNLLDNAVTHMDKPEGRIEIDCVEEDDLWKFSVADNGSGIEEKYFKKIFQIFQTLARRDEVEATGIGLTVVKKIVEVSGGTIWVESDVGEGTTFFFTLPKQEVGAKNEEFQANIVS